MKKEITEKPILFKPKMVAAILRNDKIVTRCLVEPQPPGFIDFLEYWKYLNHGKYDKKRSGTHYFKGYMQAVFPEPTDFYIKAKYWNDLLLWVKEAWGVYGYDNNSGYEISVMYTDQKTSAVIDLDDETLWQRIADREEKFLKTHDKSIMLWRSSMFMPRAVSRITLKITDTRIERLHELDNTEAVLEGCKDRDDFAHLWDEINKTPGFTWKDNPWVYRIQFEKVHNAGNAG